MTLDDALAACPVVAILRGIKPDEVLDHVEALHRAGLRGVEIPLNSPDPIHSVAKVAAAYGDAMAVGAGTVLTPAQVDEVAQAGGRIIVSPNTAPAVIRRAVALGLDPAPGVATATEALAALEAGARHLKLFPAATYGPGHVRQLKAILPPVAKIWAVGGVGADDMAAWWQAGVRAFGIGSEIYRPGQAAADTARQAERLVEAAAALGG